MPRIADCRPSLFPRLVIAGLLAALPPATASAQQSSTEPGMGLAIQGLLPGNWYLSETPAPDADTIAQECSDRIIIALGDGRWLGPVARPEATPPQLTLGMRAVCDEGPKGAVCSVEEPLGSTRQIFAEFDVTEAGHYWMRIQSFDDDEIAELYPQRCPEDALERLVINTLSAMP